VPISPSALKSAEPQSGAAVSPEAREERPDIRVGAKVTVAVEIGRAYRG
jgi:hypothetical protein